MARRSAALAEWGVDALQVGAGETALEIGTGPGVGLVLLGRAGAERVIGIDPSPVMLAQAQRRIAASDVGDRIELREGVAERLPLPDASVDAILAVNSVPYWEDPARGLAEARRVLRPGGRIVTVLQPRGARAAREFERAALREHDRLAAAGFDVLPPLVRPLRPIDACLIAGSAGVAAPRGPRASDRSRAQAGCTS
jgi:ubiquinone/menaquinone biosynthesis C-methylase UbiE